MIKTIYNRSAFAFEVWVTVTWPVKLHYGQWTLAYNWRTLTWVKQQAKEAHHRWLTGGSARSLRKLGYPPKVKRRGRKGTLVPRRTSWRSYRA